MFDKTNRRKRLDMTEKYRMGRKASTETDKQNIYLDKKHIILGYILFTHDTVKQFLWLELLVVRSDNANPIDFDLMRVDCEYPNAYFLMDITVAGFVFSLSQLCWFFLLILM